MEGTSQNPPDYLLNETIHSIPRVKISKEDHSNGNNVPKENSVNHKKNLNGKTDNNRNESNDSALEEDFKHTMSKLMESSAFSITSKDTIPPSDQELRVKIADLGNACWTVSYLYFISYNVIAFLEF